MTKITGCLHIQVLVDCSGDNGTEKTPETAFLNKKEALLQLVENNSVSKTIIFCNKVCFIQVKEVRLQSF